MGRSIGKRKHCAPGRAEYGRTATSGVEVDHLMQVRHVPCDRESLAAASSLERFDNPVQILQSTRNSSHMARRSWSAVQHDDGWSRTSVLANKKH